MNISSVGYVKHLIDSIGENSEKMPLDIHPKDEMYLFLLTMLNGNEREAAIEYFLSGRQACDTIENVVNQYKGSIEKVSSFLDFACGYGRSTRFVMQKLLPNHVWCSDIYQEAVDFQKSKFGVSGFYSFTNPDDISFPKKFDVIYVGSLFSHLPPPTFSSWLKKLYNQLEKGGILIFSTHGPSALPDGDRLSSDGYFFRADSESRSLSKDEYGTMYVSKDWVENVAKIVGVRAITYLPKELWSYQDIYVASNISIGEAQPVTYPSGAIDNVYIEDDLVRVQGWAVSEESTPIDEVEVFINGQFAGKGIMGLCRPDVRKYFNMGNYLLSGWEFSTSRFLTKKLFDDGGLMVTANLKNKSEGFVKHLTKFVAPGQ